MRKNDELTRHYREEIANQRSHIFKFQNDLFKLQVNLEQLNETEKEALTLAFDKERKLQDLQKLIQIEFNQSEQINENQGGILVSDSPVENMIKMYKQLKEKRIIQLENDLAEKMAVNKSLTCELEKTKSRLIEFQENSAQRFFDLETEYNSKICAIVDQKDLIIKKLESNISMFNRAKTAFEDKILELTKKIDISNKQSENEKQRLMDDYERRSKSSLEKITVLEFKLESSHKAFRSLIGKSISQFNGVDHSAPPEVLAEKIGIIKITFSK